MQGLYTCPSGLFTQTQHGLLLLICWIPTKRFQLQHTTPISIWLNPVIIVNISKVHWERFTLGYPTVGSRTRTLIQQILTLSVSFIHHLHQWMWLQNASFHLHLSPQSPVRKLCMWFCVLFQSGVFFRWKYCQCFHCFFPQKIPRLCSQFSVVIGVSAFIFYFYSSVVKAYQSCSLYVHINHYFCSSKSSTASECEQVCEQHAHMYIWNL